MSCDPADAFGLPYLAGPRVLYFIWTYTGNSHIGFKLTLYKKNADTGEYEVYRKAFAFKNARSYTWKKLHLGSGQEWKCEVSTYCVDCTTKDPTAVESGLIP